MSAARSRQRGEIHVDDEVGHRGIIGARRVDLDASLHYGASGASIARSPARRVQLTKDAASDSLAETLSKSELPSLIAEYGELTVDALMGDGLAKDIPFLGTVVGVVKTGFNVRDFLLTKKIIRFLGPISDVDPPGRERMIGRLQDDAGFERNVGEELLLLLDRLDSVQKATFMGRAFAAYLREEIDGSMLQRLNYAIDRVVVTDLAKLAVFSDRQLVDEATLQAFVNAGLGHVRPNVATTDVRPLTEVCRAFREFVLLEELDKSSN